jgi:hypothetical protein
LWRGGAARSHDRITSTVNITQYVYDRISYVILRGCWYDITVLNIHAPREDKTNDIKNSFYEELEHVFDKFPKYHIKSLLGDFNAKIGREDILKPTTGNKSLHVIRNDNGVRVVNLPTSKNLTSKSTIFPHHNIRKFTWNSPDGYYYSLGLSE